MNFGEDVADKDLALTGKDKALYEKSAVTHEGAERIIRKGRNEGKQLQGLLSSDPVTFT